MSDWQEIGSAPKDEDILVFCPDAREPQVVVAALVTFGNDEWEWTDVWLESNLDVEPTHWMPIPEKPNAY